MNDYRFEVREIVYSAFNDAISSGYELSFMLAIIILPIEKRMKRIELIEDMLYSEYLNLEPNSSIPPSLIFALNEIDVRKYIVNHFMSDHKDF